MPAVSVLTTAKNAENYIGEAIKSILNQTLRDFEFIIIDDASTDGTWSIISSFAAADSRVIAYRNKVSLGIAQNRNRLVKLSKGEFIAWQDADDVSLPNRLKLQRQLLLENPRLGQCGGFLNIFGASQKDFHVRRYETADKNLRKNIFKYSPVAQPVAMIRKKVYQDVGYYDPALSVAEDLDFSFRLGTKYLFANLDQPLIFYRQLKSSSTFKRLKLMEKNTLKIRLKYAKSAYYQVRLSDILYNLIQFLTLYLMPGRLRIILFNFYRRLS